MAATYTQAIARTRTLSAGSRVLYTAPEGSAVVLRDIILTSHDTANQWINLYLNTQASGPIWILANSSFAPGASVHIDMRQRLVDGDVLTLDTGASSVSILVTGYVFQ